MKFKTNADVYDNKFILNLTPNFKGSAWPGLHVAETHWDEMESVKTTSM